MRANYHSRFRKDYKKLHQKIREQLKERFLLFVKNPSDPILQDHPLRGNMKGKRSFSVTGDFRVIYRYIDKDTVILLRIGTHNQVY